VTQTTTDVRALPSRPAISQRDRVVVEPQPHWIREDPGRDSVYLSVIFFPVGNPARADGPAWCRALDPIGSQQNGTVNWESIAAYGHHDFRSFPMPEQILCFPAFLA
jgi:hypothetical protein